MRSLTARGILAALALAASSGAPRAECTCACSFGQPVSTCTQPYETPPICQRICQPPVTQQIGTNAIVQTIVPGGVYGGGVMPGGATSVGVGGTLPPGAPGGAPGAQNIGTVGVGPVGNGQVGVGPVGTGPVGAPIPTFTGR